MVTSLSGQAPPSESTAKVILVDLRVDSPDHAGQCYTSRYDKKRVELNLEWDDPLVTLEDYSFEEEPLESPGCFMPEIKLIMYRETYVFSLYCTSIMRYKNSKPYTPSSTRLRNEFEMTESMLETLIEARKKYFGLGLDSKLAEQFYKRDPLEDEDVDDSFLLEDEEDDDDDLRRELQSGDDLDDDVDDPSLQLDDTLDEGDD